MANWMRAVDGSIVNLDQASWIEATGEAYNRETDEPQPGVVAKYMGGNAYSCTMYLCDTIEEAQQIRDKHFGHLVDESRWPKVAVDSPRPGV
jgi:hypothetical protein